MENAMEKQKQTDIERQKELTDRLNRAARAYYQEDRELMSNLEYDALYDELVLLEKNTGVVLANSPTAQVGYEAVNELPKEAHESPMLSLDKPKSGRACGICGRAQNPSLLEAGRSYHCADLRKRGSFKKRLPGETA